MSEVLEQKREVILDPQNMALAEVLRQEWVIIATDGTTIEDVLKPVFWSHMAAQMQSYDRIEVREEAGSWLAELVVIRCERNWASVALLNHWNLSELRSSASVNDISAYEVKFGGPYHKWRVIRKADNGVIHSKAQTQEEALKYLREYETTLAR